MKKCCPTTHAHIYSTQYTHTCVSECVSVATDVCIGAESFRFSSMPLLITYV